MSSEIVPAGVDDLSEIPCADVQESQDFRHLNMFGVSRPDDFVAKNNVVGRNQYLTHFISPDKGPKYSTQFNPTLLSVNSLVKEMKEPSILQLRGCDQLLLPSVDFPFTKFKALTALEISGCTNLTTLPRKALSEMTQLQSLNLSHLSIRKLPDDFFSNITNLRSLILRSCSTLDSLPEFPQMNALQHLDFSFNLLIETVPPSLFPGLNKLEHLILRGCCKLCSLPSMKPLAKLKVLDLSHCIALQELKSIDLPHPSLEMLDLSYTALYPDLGYHHALTHIFLRDAKVYKLENMNAHHLRVLDLSGARNVKDLGVLKEHHELEALDLSRTRIESIGFIESVDFISEVGIHYKLRYLILRECTSLVRLPAMQILINLEVLDLSSCELLVELPEDLSSLEKLKELNLSGCSGLRELREGLFHRMSCLEKLDLSKTNLTHLPSFANLTSLQMLNLSHTSFANLTRVENLLGEVSWDGNNTHPRCLQASVSKPNEFHLTSTFFSSKSSLFDKFIVEFLELASRISCIQRDQFNLSSPDADLKYIYHNINLLESSSNCQAAEKLLLDLFANTDVSRPSLQRTKNLHPTIVKLKLLIPPKKGDGLKEYIDDKEVDKEREDEEVEVKEDKKDVEIEVEEDEVEIDEEERLAAFTSLEEMEKNCLLYLAIFPLHEKFMMEERILIQLWYGAGFIDHQHNATFEETGRRILMVLEQKIPIWRGLMADTESRIMFLDHRTHTFIKTQAKKLHFFGLTGCQIACLMKSKNKFPSFCNVGVTHTNSYEYLKHLEPIRTLININECNLYIKADWFSEMTNLVVLQLGSRYSKYKHIEVFDLKFLDELKNMKNLMLLSLEGFTSLLKLPDCVCQTTSLKILNLRDCAYLEELPADIGSLENLTHLDVTHCRAFSKLPKGLELLSKLEVLKGFLINYEAGGKQHKKACTLGDLLKLNNLRKLNLVVNKERFPDHFDLLVFKDMKSLCSLKITWEKDYNIYKEPEDVKQYTRWQHLKCWKVKTHQNDTKEPLRSLNHFSNLQKLVLCCFPSETAPNWLHQNELQKLEKLYIVGGELKTLAGDANQNTWNVKTLRLRYLRNFEMEWEELKRNFPHMSRFENHRCDHLSSCPHDEDDKWTKEIRQFEYITYARELPQCFVRRMRDDDDDDDDDYYYDDVDVGDDDDVDVDVDVDDDDDDDVVRAGSVT